LSKHERTRGRSKREVMIIMLFYWKRASSAFSSNIHVNMIHLACDAKKKRVKEKKKKQVSLLSGIAVTTLNILLLDVIGHNSIDRSINNLYSSPFFSVLFYFPFFLTIEIYKIKCLSLDLC
jgi:hypothetical protein